MLASFFSMLFSTLLTIFALAPFFVDQTLRFLMAKEIDGVMIVLTILTVATIGLLVQGLSSRPVLGRGSGLVALLVFGVWTLSVCLVFWTTVEPLWQRTVPGIIFALASLWLPFLAWMPFWSLSFTNRVVIILALLFLQPFFVLRYKIQPLNPQGQFVVVKRSDLYRQMASASADAPTPQNPSQSTGNSDAVTVPMPSNSVNPLPPPAPAPVRPNPMPAGWEFFSSRAGLGKIDAPEPNLVTIDIARSDNAKSWDVEWAKPGIALTKDLPLDVSFRAKATQSRSIQIRFQQNHAPWSPIGLDQQVELTSDWKDYKFTGVASETENNARFALQLGGAPEQISIADLQISPGESGFAKKAAPEPVVTPQTKIDSPPAAPSTSPPPVATQPAPNAAIPVPLEGWTLSTADGSASALSIQIDPFPFLRVTVPTSNPDDDWKVMLVRDDLTLEKGKTYIVKIRARANMPRRVRVVATLPAPPWTGVGLFESIQLTTDWKESMVEFVANQNGPCRFYVALAGQEASMDFSSIELTPKR